MSLRSAPSRLLALLLIVAFAGVGCSKFKDKDADEGVPVETLYEKAHKSMTNGNWSGAEATPASDVYAATAVCYEALTGRRPYEGRTLHELAVAHQSLPVPVENVPQGLRDLVAAGLSKDVRGRPQGAFAYLLELEMTAGAAYGADWEDRGRAQLKSRALALAVLFRKKKPLPLRP